MWSWFGDTDTFTPFDAEVSAKLESEFQAKGNNAKTCITIGGTRYTVQRKGQRWIQHRTGNPSRWREVQRTADSAGGSSEGGEFADKAEEVDQADKAENGAGASADASAVPLDAGTSAVDGSTTEDEDEEDVVVSRLAKRKAPPTDDLASMMMRGEFDHQPEPAAGSVASSTGESSHDEVALQSLLRRAPDCLREDLVGLREQLVNVLGRSADECALALENVEQELADLQSTEDESVPLAHLKYFAMILRERAREDDNPSPSRQPAIIVD